MIQAPLRGRLRGNRDEALLVEGGAQFQRIQIL
jgi:hypothetical protein